MLRYATQSPLPAFSGGAFWPGRSPNAGAVRR